jgi:adenosylmethionine-8-amino-7-oxononanoate aminotransferase
VINKFLFKLENELGKKLILIGQCFDGASALWCQVQGHIRSRIVEGI